MELIIEIKLHKLTMPFNYSTRGVLLRWSVRDITIKFFLLKLSPDKFKLSRDN